MGKKRIKLKKTEAVDVNTAANALVTVLIGRHGIRQALVIARKIHEQVFANYKRIGKKYGQESLQ